MTIFCDNVNNRQQKGRKIVMDDTIILNNVRQQFKKFIPSTDSRCKLSPFDLVVCLVFSFLGCTTTPCLEDIRRNVLKQWGQKLSRSSFWERLSRKRLNNLLKDLIGGMMCQWMGSIWAPKALCQSLGVDTILLIDSSTISLWDGLKNIFPGTGTTAGIKIHMVFDICRGKMEWFKLTASSVHDRKCFPDIATLKNKLIIMDLGYWDFSLMLAIKNAEGFFLSRIKSNAELVIDEVIQGMSKRHEGNSLLNIKFKKKRTDIIETIVSKVVGDDILRCRAIGFWNPENKTYHWYITNLNVAATVIYPLYRLRWQIELIFKGLKQSLNMDRLTSNNPFIIKNLVLASLAAQLASHTLLSTGMSRLNEKQQCAISFQRIYKILSILAQEFTQYLLQGTQQSLHLLSKRILLFIDEIFDPNYRKRNSSLGAVASEIGGLP